MASWISTGGEETRFSELTFRQFVAGELEIILESKPSQAEQLGRLNLMKKMAYLVGGYEWKQVREVYGYVVTRIERGLLRWSDNMGEEIQWALQRRVPSQMKANRNNLGRKPLGERLWYFFDKEC